MHSETGLWVEAGLLIFTFFVVVPSIAAAFPSGLPNNLDSIRSAADNFSRNIQEELYALDKEFYAYPHDLVDLLFAYVKQNPDEFGTLPEPDDA